jgi:alpha-L-fucosidase
MTGPHPFGDARDWFATHRFGLFVHWGLYAINGIHEQEQWRCHVDRPTYRALADRFAPRRFDPDAWVAMARAAGMSYLVLTAKHHDGFCLWDTRHTAFTAMTAPARRDLVGEVAAACQRGGMRFGIYYSVVDWHHPAYPNEGRHHELPPQPGDRQDMAAYAAFVAAQVEELTTRYGEISNWFWDMNVPEWQDPSINALIRRNQPGCVINDRGFGPGDLGSPEREFHGGIMAQRRFARPTQYCNSVGRWAWGFKADEDWFSAAHLRYQVAEVLGKGGNMLLNVGPDADGVVPRPAERRLRDIGAWHQAVAEAFSGTWPCSELTSNQDVLLTRSADRLYVILHRPPSADGLPLLPLAGSPTAATLLNDGRPVACDLRRLPLVDAPLDARHLRLRHLPLELAAQEPLVVRLDGLELPPAAAAAPPPSTPTAGASPTSLHA